MKQQAPTYKLQPEFPERLEKFVEQFLSAGFDTFRKDFDGIDAFVKMATDDSGDRDDHNMRRTPKELYLLEAVSFRIYDALARERFNQIKNTLIILPDCLSLHNPDCIKSEGDYGDRCALCLPECQAFDVCELADRYGVEVVFSKRALTEQLEHYKDQAGDLSVIGIACLTMLARGMRTARDVDIPARGVLLNFTGCDHWNDKPFASAFDHNCLEAILKEKYEL
jgi:hypothetical protein